MTVVVTVAAMADLSSIGDFVRQGSATRAFHLVESLLEKCDFLAEQPLGSPLVPRYEHFAIRRLVHGNYLIFYRVRGERIEVIRILHGARDYERLLFLEGE